MALPHVAWLGHATALIDVGGTRVLTDPVLHRRVGALLRVAPAVAASAYRGIDAVLLSHLHSDHADLRSLRLIGADVRVLAPRGAGAWLRRRGLRGAEEISVGASARVGALRITAVPAGHDGRRHRLGPEAETIGFVVRGERSVYFAGDTDLFDTMAEVADGVDAALLPVAGWGPTLGPGHLDPERAAEAAARIRPRIAIPIHWGTLAPPFISRGVSDVAARRFAALVAAASPGIDVRVLAPGQETSLA